MYICCRLIKYYRFTDVYIGCPVKANDERLVHTRDVHVYVQIHHFKNFIVISLNDLNR